MIDRSNQTLNFSLTGDNRAVSPVIAVALMVGLAVALAGLIGVATTGIIGDLGSGPDGQVTFDQTGTEVDITLQSVGDDVTAVHVRGAGSTEDAFAGPSAGQVHTVTGVAEGDRITVVADDGNGNTQQIGVFEVGSTS